MWREPLSVAGPFDDDLEAGVGDQPVLEGGGHPFYTALGLWRHGEDLLDAQLPHHPGELGGLVQDRPLAGVVLEGGVAIAVQGEGSPTAGPPLQQDQIAPRVLGGMEDRLGVLVASSTARSSTNLSARSSSQGWGLPST